MSIPTEVATTLRFLSAALLQKTHAYEHIKSQWTGGFGGMTFNVFAYEHIKSQWTGGFGGMKT
jgi:hypothetical protein